MGFLLAGLASAAMAQLGATPPADTDRDGLSDEVEQALLEQFRPVLMISASDCAAKPARFRAGSAEPVVVARDGTIYGQVFPAPNDQVEIHYYVLWDRDCGRIGHPLDAEHLSALISQSGGNGPEARYWYAGAHERTACDASSGARATVLQAKDRGPVAWVSSGKHAMYLARRMCGGGCGGDTCADAVELRLNGKVINIGERNALSPDASWVASSRWLMAAKLESDFPAGVISALEQSNDEVITLGGNRSMRGAIRGGDETLDGVAVGAQHTDAALRTADRSASSSLGKAARATGRSLSRAWDAVRGRRQSPATAPAKEQ